MKKKILFLSPIPPPHYGASLLCEKCLNILKKSGEFEVHNIKLNYSEKMNDVGKINLKKIAGIFKVRGQIINEIKKFKPDFIYFAPATSGLGLIRDNFFAQIIKKRNIPIIFHVHSRANSKKPPEVRRLKAMFSGEKAIILGKKLVVDVDWVLPKEKIRILPNATENEISKSSFNQINKKREDNEKTNILFLSNMIESKGWFKLLEACKILKDKKIDFNCNFAGAWPSEKEKEKFFYYVKENVLNNVKYLGKKTGTEKNELFASSDVFVFPTEYPLETFGLVILEAMMLGLPVIANDVATISSTVTHNKTGFVLKENTPKEIYEYLETLINDKKLRIDLGQNGRRRFLENFEMKDYGEKFIKIIKNF